MSYLSFCNDESYLAHHGIKGMKWGVRRFQKKNGSLTPRGKNHRKDTKRLRVKMAKGAAITAGLLAGSYGAMVLSEEINANKDFKKVKAMTDNLVSKHLSDLTQDQQNVARQLINNTNNRIFAKQRIRKYRAQKGQVKDAFNAYINPRTASAENRSNFRTNRQNGYYRVDTSDFNDIGVINDRNFSRFEKGIRQRVDALK